MKTAPHGAVWRLKTNIPTEGQIYKIRLLYYKKYGILDKKAWEGGLKIIIAIGERGEMLFNKRRVSRDEYIIDDIIKVTGGNLTVKPYSAKLFARYPEVKITEGGSLDAGTCEWCFIEDEELFSALKDASALLIYNFNRTYPSDVKFDTVPVEMGFSLKSESSFAGHSHDKITRLLYER